VAVDATHSGYLMTHPLRPEQVTNARFLHPGLMAVPEAVRRQPGQDRQPGRERRILGGRLAAPPALTTVGVV
jgi:hypothetical protein